MNFTYQWGHLSWFVNAWLEQGPTDWCRKARGWATEDHCSRSGRGGGDWTWGWLGELTLLDESCWVWGELPQSWEASLKKMKTVGQILPLQYPYVQTWRKCTHKASHFNGHCKKMQSLYLPWGKAQDKVGVRSWALCTICWWTLQLPVCPPNKTQ